jgi:hypothetical protein
MAIAGNIKFLFPKDDQATRGVIVLEGLMIMITRRKEYCSGGREEYIYYPLMPLETFCYPSAQGRKQVDNAATLFLLLLETHIF